LKAEISLRNVGFSYGDSKKVLNSINLDVKEGQALALVGHSGSGKTTLVSLLPRFYELSEGEIFIGGKEIREYKLDEYRHLFGIVPQEVVLFKGTVCDNVRFAKPDASKEEVEAACKAANAHDFILEMENGYDTELSEMGVGLSGGQRQRIAIARAILKDPRILILDEATSALDSQSEQVVQEALERLMKNRTTFVIAHRISTVMNSDRIVVLDQGRIEAMGTHEELLRNSRIYPELCKGLADKEEAA
jgi:ABC-type multidrug transport system fused ATPase/permease subunit